MLYLIKKVKTNSIRKTKFAIMHLVKRYKIQTSPLEIEMLIHRLALKYYRVDITRLELLEHIRQEVNLINKRLGLTSKDFEVSKPLINQKHQEDVKHIETKLIINDVIERSRKINDKVSMKLEIIFSEYDYSTELNKIKSLILKDCELNEISIFSLLSNLEVLDLGNNNIKDISPISNLIGIKQLNLGDNNIDDIRCLESLTSLKLLKIGKNKIKDKNGNVIETKDENEFKWLAGLSKLYLLKIEF